MKREKRTIYTTNHARAILPTLFAVGSSLAAGQAGALELGPIDVHSKLGQPLRASIAYALGPNEMLESYCVSLAKDRNGFADVVGTRVSIANGIISLTGRTPVSEPLLTANLVVNCPYAAKLSRNYSMFVDPVDHAVAFADSATPEPEAVAPAVAPAEPVAREPVVIGSRYQVQRGDTLSEIAWRLDGREISLQAAMDGILAANPGAFTNQDPNRLLAGRWLDIPAFAGSAVAERPSVAIETETIAASEPAAIDTTPAASADDAGATYEVGTGAAAETADAATASVTPPVQEAEAVTAQDVSNGEAAATQGFDELRPGDIVDESLVAGAATATVVIPDTRVAAPTAAAPVTPAPAAGGSPNWLPWSLAGFFAFLSGYLAFGARLRQRFGSTPVGAAPVVERRVSQPAAITVPESEMEVEELQPAYATVDFDLSDNSPTDENPALDANLFSGAGLEDTSDVVEKQEFGFASTTSIDMELPDRPAVMDLPETDIIAQPERTREEMILNTEVLPDDDEYDMSIIVDATKMPDPEDVTERDLKAVPVDEDDGQTLITDVYTINDEVDIDMLEQDYDDELTATQALNAEIEKAAADLARDMDEEEEEEEEADASGETSVQVRLASVTDLDLTAEMAAKNDEKDADDDTTSLEVDDETIEMTANNKTAG
jgi:phage tail protein X